MELDQEQKNELAEVVKQIEKTLNMLFDARPSVLFAALEVFRTRAKNPKSPLKRPYYRQAVKLLSYAAN